MTNRQASEEAADRLGYGAPDPRAEVLADMEALLSRRPSEWSADDRAAARAAIDRAKALPELEPEKAPDRRPATASELAGAQMRSGRDAARDLARDGVEHDA